MNITIDHTRFYMDNIVISNMANLASPNSKGYDKRRSLQRYFKKPKVTSCNIHAQSLLLFMGIGSSNSWLAEKNFTVTP